MISRILRPNRSGTGILILLVMAFQAFLFFSMFSNSGKVVNEAEWTRNIRELYDLRKFKEKTEVIEAQKNMTQTMFGPGEYGRAFNVKEDDLDAADKVKFQEGYTEHGFNEYASDMISLHRKLPPAIEDDRCSSIKYPEDLPTVSVIIPFRNEAWSTLLRTVHAVCDRSSAKLLKEVILVDDNSTLPHLKRKLEVYIRELPNVTLLRLDKPSGLMMARQAGIEMAKYQVIVVMDSHVEVGPGWLEPLLHPIYLNSKVMTFPSVDNINKDDFTYSGGKLDSVIQVPNFDFYLNMVFSTLTKEYEAERKSKTDPVLSPTIQGWMFAMNREFFLELGGFDPGMDVWGAEQFELSFKVWMCGGQIKLARCSHAGHVYRQVKWKNFWGIYLKNNYRLAETWMDEYAIIHKEKTGFRGDAGDITARKQIRQRLQCKSFSWYIDTITKFVRMYLPLNRKAKGAIKNLSVDLCIRSKHHGSTEEIPRLKPCREGFEYDWDWSDKDELRHQYQCFDISQAGKVITLPCDRHREKPYQKWDYSEANTIIHRETGKCLSAPAHAEPESMLELVDCDVTSLHQQWNWTRLT